MSFLQIEDKAVCRVYWVHRVRRVVCDMWERASARDHRGWKASPRRLV